MSSSDGKHRGPARRIELTSPGASASEAAAIVAAVEQFLADTTPPSEPRPEVSAWQRAALIEGVCARRFDGGYVWGQLPRPAR